MTQVGDAWSTQRNGRIEIHSIFAGSCVASPTRHLLASYSEPGLRLKLLYLISYECLFTPHCFWYVLLLDPGLNTPENVGSHKIAPAEGIPPIIAPAIETKEHNSNDTPILPTRSLSNQQY